ncbi:MAG: hypothetical protein D6732_27590 [Methanobacteriota archaeon]|nr:MAG: hypothetical protein D6732_27590 [Euryarchaeota archaeon]
MNKAIKIILSLVSMLVFFMNCKKSTDAVTISPIDDNLILNSSFETESGPSLKGWIYSNTAEYGFFPDAPDGGGRYSLILRPVWRGYFSFNAVMTKIALPTGTHWYRLSCWGRKQINGAGSIHLFVGKGNVDTMTATLTIPVVDSLWTFYSTEIEITNNSNDSAVVALHGGYSPIQYLADSTFFDLCKFERLD